DGPPVFGHYLTVDLPREKLVGFRPQIFVKYWRGKGEQQNTTAVMPGLESFQTRNSTMSYWEGTDERWIETTAVKLFCGIVSWDSVFACRMMESSLMGAFGRGTSLHSYVKQGRRGRILGLLRAG
ncbi:hypothetical protein FOZ63_021024, partial [Perkinsus olseni]